MNNIEKFLDQASAAYYNGNPIISDAQFDNLAELANYNKIGTSRINGHIGKHFNRMYSLQKYYKDTGKDDPLHGCKDISYSPKLDGAAVSVLYVNGELTQVLTRGDGIEGEIITDKFLATNIIPNHVPRLEGVIQLTGEIVAPSCIPNARNYAAGALRLKDISEFRTRAIQFVSYEVSPNLSDTYDEDMRILSSLGFSTVKDSELHNIYPTDGIVFRVNNHKEARAMGYTSKHPRFAYALKDREDCVETEILSVEWNTGRSGAVTPVAILKPVMVDDKEVSRVALKNAGFIEALGLCIGDSVGIRLAGKIIPEIVYRVDS
jgi:DNA ligase (NAD+)